MHEHGGLSPTHEMYLKVIYRLQQGDEIARVRDMAKGLGVTPGTVSAVLKKLEIGGLVIHDRYGAVKLTAAGQRVAECVIRRFEILHAVLTEVLGIDAESAEVDACTMEHAVGPATVNRMEHLVGLVRAGRIDVRPMLRARSPKSTVVCSECEVIGTCQAALSVEVSSSRPAGE